MENNWMKILVFTLLALVLGFILGRVTGKQPCSHHQMMHQDKCSAMDNAGHKMMWIDEDGRKTVKIEKHIEMDGDGEFDENHTKVKAVIEGIEHSDFEGDSSFTIGKANVKLSRRNGEMKVEVSVEDED
ncbi:MAG: hypothetical protein RLP15_11085 [Cryomorphaceae bacterium]